jgi:hypothetical protein
MLGNYKLEEKTSSVTYLTSILRLVGSISYLADWRQLLCMAGGGGGLVPTDSGADSQPTGQYVYTGASVPT